MRLPLPTLLSQALVAYTIEFDNEFEHQMPHRTTNYSSATNSHSGPWLVSLVMWSNFLQFVEPGGVTVGELQRRARVTNLSLSGMERWRYVVVAPDAVEPDANDAGPKPPLRDWVVRLTEKGQQAQQVWRPLFGVIERRWQERFGKPEILRLRESLSALVSQFHTELPEFLPVLGYGLAAKVPELPAKKATIPDRPATSDLHLAALLAKTLLTFTLEFESESELSLAIGANILRVLDTNGERKRDLPRLTGISKEAIKVAVSFLEKRGYAQVAPNPAAKAAKLVRLTAKGRQAQEDYLRRIGDIEQRWQARFGEQQIRNLRQSLEPLVGKPNASPLFRGLEPYPDGWRGSVPQPQTLPYYPMVLHRGGFPDGS